METVPWQERYADKVKPARQALRVIKRGDSVFIGSGAAEPQLLVRELARMSMELALLVRDDWQGKRLGAFAPRVSGTDSQEP